VRLKAIGGFTLAISCSFNIVARFRVLSVVAIFAFALARLFGFNDGGINIWRFRQLLNTEQLLEPLLKQINTHLERNSITVSLGSINIIDATVIEAKQRQILEWSGTFSDRLRLIKHLNIRSLAICFSKASSLKLYQAWRIRILL
jgi:hypothetical protein